MSAIGKLFVVLNLVFSLVILGVVGGILTKSEGYMKQVVEVQSQFDTEKAAWEQAESDYKTENQSLKTQLASTETQRDDLKVNNGSLMEQLSSEKLSNTELRNTMDGLQASYNAFTTTLTETIRSNNELNAANQELIAARNDAVNDKRAAEANAARLAQDVASLEAAVMSLQASLAEMTGVAGDLNAQIEAAVQMGFDIAKVAAAPQIDGVVERVNRDLGIVVLSVGGDDGVTRGTRFEIHSNGQYKGYVVVDDVYPDNAAARIVKGLDSISEMDEATTRL